MSHETSVGWDSSLRKPLASGGPDPSHMLAVIGPSADSGQMAWADEPPAP